MQLRSALLAATMLAVPVVASAQPVTGLYVGAGVGVNIMSQEQIKNLSFPTLGAARRRSFNVGQRQRQYGLRRRAIPGLGLRQWPAGGNRGRLPQ